MARQWALRAVRKLQARLAATDHPEELRKSLQMLSDLPMVAEILEETGVQRAVERLCRHHLVGPLARDLAERWNNLVSLERELQYLESHPLHFDKSCSQKRPRDALQEKVETDWQRQCPDRNFSAASQVACRDHLKKPTHTAGQQTQAHQEPGPGCFHLGEGPADQGPKEKRRACFHPTGEALSSPQEEEAAFLGQRIYARMPVFGGSKRRSVLPKTTLNQQDLQDLAKDMNSNSGVRGGPYSVPESRLQKCTPEDRCHLEKHSEAAVGEREELWKMRCLKDYKEEKPREHESWREMYLRLQDAREQRLQALTHRIQSAQAQKPQDRRTKMISFISVGKPPQEVPGRQERVAMPGEAPLSMGSKKTASGSDSHPPGRKPNPARPPLAPLLNTNKPTAKKMAPLMAKAMKDYKKRVSRG